MTKIDDVHKATSWIITGSLKAPLVEAAEALGVGVTIDGEDAGVMDVEDSGVVVDATEKGVSVGVPV